MAETTTQRYTVRHATEADVSDILDMIKELAIYEKSLSEVEATPEKLLATLSFPSDPTKGFAKTLLIFPTSSSASLDDTRGTDASSKEAVTAATTTTTRAAGMALYFFNYSTWTAAPGIYLEDLYVREDCRGRGYGKALLQALARECLARGCKRLDWSVLKWNRPSIDFYESEAVGARMMSEWVGMRVDGDALGKLAGGRG